MTTFVILAIVLSVAVLLAVLWPLWRDARGLVLAGVATLGVATFALYMTNGENKLIYYVVRPLLNKHYDSQSRNRQI